MDNNTIHTYDTNKIIDFLVKENEILELNIQPYTHCLKEIINDNEKGITLEDSIKLFIKINTKFINQYEKQYEVRTKLDINPKQISSQLNSFKREVAIAKDFLLMAKYLENKYSFRRLSELVKRKKT